MFCTFDAVYECAPITHEYEEEFLLCFKNERLMFLDSEYRNIYDYPMIENRLRRREVEVIISKDTDMTIFPEFRVSYRYVLLGVITPPVSPPISLDKVRPYFTIGLYNILEMDEEFEYV